MLKRAKKQHPRIEFSKRVKNIELSYATNTQFNYSNTGYALLGEVVLAVSGMDYEDYVQKFILEPIKLDHKTRNARGNAICPMDRT